MTIENFEKAKEIIEKIRLLKLKKKQLTELRHSIEMDDEFNNDAMYSGNWKVELKYHSRNGDSYHDTRIVNVSKEFVLDEIDNDISKVDKDIYSQECQFSIIGEILG